MNSCIYEGWVRHRRYQPVEHRFRTRLFFMYLDLEELDKVFRGRWLWSHRRLAAGWFRRQDHFGDPNISLSDSIRELVSCRGPIRVLTHLRYFGYVFNPLSLFFCFPHRDAAAPAEIVAEVQNTPWNEKHCYVLSRDHFHPQNSNLTPKRFHVSPFMSMDMSYRWSITDPSDSLAVSLQNLRNHKKLFDVTMQLRRREISSATLTRMLIRYPFMTQQVIASIYWQAFRLWRKGVPFIPHPRKNPGNTPDGHDQPENEASVTKERRPATSVVHSD